MSELRLIIPGDVNELSPNKRYHWRLRHRLEQEWQTKARLLWRDAGEPVFYLKVRISFIVRRPRLLDECNLHGSRALKAIVDGLKHHCFGDDNPRFVTWGTVTQEQRRGPCEVEVLVEEITPPK